MILFDLVYHSFIYALIHNTLTLTYINVSIVLIQLLSNPLRQHTSWRSQQIKELSTMNTDPNIFEQPEQTPATMERTEINKYKIPILSDRDTDLTKINPRMWWEQISEYIDLTYCKNQKDLMDQGTETMDAHTAYHIKSDVI